MNDPDIRAISKWLNENTAYIPRDDIAALIFEYEQQNERMKRLERHACALAQLISAASVIASEALLHEDQR